jgi:hypothetical protein
MAAAAASMSITGAYGGLCRTIEAVLRRLDARIGLAAPEEREQISHALRVVQDF